MKIKIYKELQGSIPNIGGIGLIGRIYARQVTAINNRKDEPDEMPDTCKIMKLDGFGLFVKDMGAMIRFYRDVLGFEIKENEGTSNVYLIKDGTLFLLYGRQDFERMTSRKFEYAKGIHGHIEIALYVDTFKEVDEVFAKVVALGAEPVLEPTTEPWGQRTCYIADPEGNLIEIGSFNRPFDKRGED